MNDAKFHYENEHQNLSKKIKAEPEGIATENNTDNDNIVSNEAAEIKTEPEEISTENNKIVRFTEYIDNIDGIETEEAADIKTEPEGISSENNRIVRFTEYIDNILGYQFIISLHHTHEKSDIFDMLIPYLPLN